MGALMSDLGIIWALFGYLLRSGDDADIMLGSSLEGFANPSLSWTLISMSIFRWIIFNIIYKRCFFTFTVIVRCWWNNKDRVVIFVVNYTYKICSYWLLTHSKTWCFHNFVDRSIICEDRPQFYQRYLRNNMRHKPLC